MTAVRELCRILATALHLPGVDRWAEQLGSHELLPGLDHDAYALDAALLLAAVVAAPRPADAPLGSSQGLSLSASRMRRRSSSVTGSRAGGQGHEIEEIRWLTIMERNKHAKAVVQDIEAQRQEATP